MKLHALKSATLAAALMMAAGVATAQSPFCGSPNFPIPDGNPTGVTDTIVIPNNFTLTDLNVSLNVTHTYVGDLIFFLTNVLAGVTVTLYDRPGVPGSGCSEDNIDATLDDEGGGGPVENMCASLPPAIFDTPTPNNPLSAFDGLNIQGTWRLTAIDAAVQDVGQLNTWCLITTPVPVELMGFEVN